MIDLLLIPESGEVFDAEGSMEWCVEEGESLKLDQPILEIESDKEVRTTLAQFDGVLRRALLKKTEDYRHSQQVVGIATSGNVSDALVDAVVEIVEKENLVVPESASNAKRRQPWPLETISLLVYPYNHGGGGAAAILQWYAEEGKPISQGQPLVEVEHYKAVRVLFAARDGVLWKILTKPDDHCEMGQLIAIITSGDVPEELREATHEFAIKQLEAMSKNQQGS